jgi:hypothetical protein
MAITNSNHREKVLTLRLLDDGESNGEKSRGCGTTRRLVLVDGEDPQEDGVGEEDTEPWSHSHPSHNISSPVASLNPHASHSCCFSWPPPPPK